MRTFIIAGLIASMFGASAAEAKSIGLKSPGGRKIYEDSETFEHVTNQELRRMIVEVATGIGPEGNLAMLFGWLPRSTRPFEFYAGVGLELNPAIQYTLTTRARFQIGSWRPYVGVGYLYKRLFDLGTDSHHVFGEVGYQWKLHTTYRLTVGIGVRRLLTTVVRSDSPLNQPNADPELLQSALDNISPWVPTLALRFSRAF